jgi:hypothetical protein
MTRHSRAIELRVGESREVRLARSGGGYRWISAVSADSEAIDVQIAYAEGELVRGRWRDEVATIRAVQPGHATIRFSLRREWEEQSSTSDEDGDDATSIDVTVVGA